MRTLALALCAAATPVAAAPPRPVARLFVQDTKAGSLRWADVRADDGGALSLGPVGPVAGFPALDPARQKLVQMKESAGFVCVGVRDAADGALGSGWVLVRSGVTHDDHGDHAHWSFKKKPAVVDTRLDKLQGNPAHLYRYGGRFFVANDKLGGCTRIDPAKYDGTDKDLPRFLAGGGGHITLAVADDAVSYATWIDGGGPNKGRVDVTPVGPGARSEPAYSFKLPTGGLHGATANAGKVFFAPADGVCWVLADPGAKLKPDQVKVHHIPLGTDGDKPRRTGAFATHGHHVLCVTGKGTGGSLVLLDAAAAEPKPVVVALGGKPGTQPVTPAVAEGPGGKAYAFVCLDRQKDADAEERLAVIALDPDGNGDYADARPVKTLAVGKSAVDGHNGHHDVAFDAAGRFAFVANPGDGTVTVLSLKTLDVAGTFAVGGAPGAVVAVGAADADD